MRNFDNRNGGILRTLLKQLGGAGLAAMLLATVAVIAAGTLSNLPAVLLGDIVDKIVDGQALDGVWRVFALIVACLIGRIALVTVQKYLVERSSVRIQKRVFLDNVSKVLSVRFDALQAVRVGEATSRLEKRVNGSVRFLKLIFLEGLPQLAIAVPALILAYWANVVAGSVMIVVLGLSVAITTAQILSQRGIRIALINKGAGLAGQLAELLGHLDFVRAAGMAVRVERRFEGEAESMRKIEFTHHKWMMSFDAIKSLVEEGGLAFIVAIGIWQVASGNMSSGTILTLAMLYKSAALPLQNLHRVVDELHESVLQLGAAASIVDHDDDPGLDGAATPITSEDAPILSARNFTLRRTSPDGSSLRVLSNINLQISANEIIGIAGPSGGGKSTLLKAMLGLFPDYEGDFLMFGRQVREIDKERLSDMIAYGPQKTYVCHGSVRSNIVDGCVRTGSLPDADITRGLQRAQLNIGLDVHLSERGDNISPGQAQRLSLARVFAKESSRLVVLDEATSMLDGRTQTKTMQELRELAAGKALVMVAHRLDTLRFADRIIVLDGGEIVQIGSFNELSDRPGVFRDLLGAEPVVFSQAAE